MSKCTSCGDFYGHENFKMECSYCFQNINKKTVKELKDDFVNKFLIKSDSMIKSIEVCLKKNLPNSEKFIIELYETMLKPSKKFFFADEIIKLIKMVDNEKIKHLLVSMVGDWWNITTTKGWSNSLVCYYGNFNEDIDINYEIRMPHSVYYGTSAFASLLTS